MPGPPGRPTVFDVSRDGMTVAWNPPEEDGGLEVSGYIVERKEVRAERWVRANKNPVTMTRYRSTGLIEGLEYEHRITAINTRGISKPSLLSKPAVATDPIGERALNLTHLFGYQNVLYIYIYVDINIKLYSFVFFSRPSWVPSEPQDHRHHQVISVTGLERS